MGFSPFEVLYGRTVRGPLMLMKEIWTNDVEQLDTKTTYQCVLDLHQRLEDTCALVHQELRNAQKKQKRLYDRNTKLPKIEPGDKVLVFLPSDNNKLLKLLLQWKGPYDVLERVV